MKRRKTLHAGRTILVAFGLIAIGTACSGCLWLAVPSLAYQGYKYESGKNGQSNQTRQHQDTQSSSSADDVE